MSKERKKEETIVKSVPQKTGDKPKLRQVLIETDGNVVNVSANTMSGNLELIAALQSVIGFISNKNN